MSLHEDVRKERKEDGFMRRRHRYQGKLPSSQTSNDVSCAYEEYLVLLQQRNKILRRLKKKSKNQIELERKEQGFSLYLNGANVDSGKEKQCNRINCYPRDNSSPVVRSNELGMDKHDGRSSLRRKWQFESLQTQEDLLTNCKHDQKIDGMEVEENKLLQEHDIPEQLRLSFHDLKVLRKHLEGNAEIQKSISEHVSDKENTLNSEDEVPDFKDEVAERMKEKELSPKRSKRSNRRRSSCSFLPSDVIVLELAASAVAPINTFTGPVKCLSPSLEHNQLDIGHLAVYNKGQVKEEYGEDESQNGDEVLGKVIDHVVNMQPRQQRQLLRALGNLEATAERSLTEDVTSTSSSSDQAGQVHPSTRPMCHSDDQVSSSCNGHNRLYSGRVQRPVSNLLKGQKLDANTQDEHNVKLQVHQAGSQASAHVITITLKSNWGHLSRVGLTEVQLLQSNGCPLPLQANTHLSCGPVSDVKGSLDNLLNGRTKTTKEKNMWSCQLGPGQCIELYLKPPAGCPFTNLIMWNFNKSIQDLNIGAKAIEVMLDNEVVYSGHLEKGCGNQVFDYSQCIQLQKIGSMSHSKTFPSAESIFSMYMSPRHSLRRNQSAKSSVDSIDLSDGLRSESGYHQQRLSSLEWLDEDRPRSRPAGVHGRQASWFVTEDQQSTSSGSQSRPSWLEKVRPAAEVAAQTSIADRFDADTDLCASLPAPRAAPIQSEQLSDANAKYGRRSKAHSALPMAASYAGSENKDMGAAATATGTLEHYWSSLHVFDQCHKGQLINFDNDDRMLEDDDDHEQCASQMLDDQQSDEDEFIIPELPCGQLLTINIKSTWGDQHYVGLNAIELFSQTGDIVNIAKIWANPSDINVLDEYINDPRVVSNLIDGVNCTRDDMHLWLAPFTPHKSHYIYMKFDKSVNIAMIRIWNYNKSRIHSFRGAKHVEIFLDDLVIFKGEIAKASGHLQGHSESFGDTILFTTDEQILEAIAVNDNSFIDSVDDHFYPDQLQPSVVRPTTGDRSTIDSPSQSRPLTVAGTNYDDDDGECIECNELLITVTSTWSQSSMVGLNGLEVIGEHNEPIGLHAGMVSIVNGAGATKSRLIDGVNVSSSDKHMWNSLYDVTQPCSIHIQLANVCKVYGLRIWNYNASLDASYCGVRTLTMKALANGHPVAFYDWLVRRAPGNCYFDFAQELSCNAYPSWYSLDEPVESSLPQGFVFQLQLLSTWGDQYYIGLNGVQLYDAHGQLIPLDDNNISAYPSSVNVLDAINDDLRTPDKLIDGINHSSHPQHCWLAPVLPATVNRVYIIFDVPVSLSMIKLWNYSKSPLRAVRDFALLVDDIIIYNGTLNEFDGRHETIMFSNDTQLLSAEKYNIIKNQDCDQDVRMTDSTSSSKHVNQALRPQTGVQRNSSAR